MPFSRPTLNDVIERILADLSSRMIGVDGAVLRRSVLGALGRAEAGAAHELHGHLAWIADQVIIDTADADNLERWAEIWGIRRKPAQYASGELHFTGSTGAVIPVGTALQRQDGVEFVTQVEAVVSGSGAVAIAAAVLAGATGNTASSVTLGLQQPVAGVSGTATVGPGGLANGSDVEDDDSLRARLLARLRKPPHGGALHDYEMWALEVPGVTRVWVKPEWQGLGTVGVLFVRDGDPSIIPDQGEIDVVAAYIEERRPVTARVYVLAPLPAPLDITVQLKPNTPGVQAAVRAELADLLTRESQPGGMILKSRLDEAVSIAEGELDHFIVSPAGNIEHGAGVIAALGTVTFQDLP